MYEMRIESVGPPSTGGTTKEHGYQPTTDQPPPIVDPPIRRILSRLDWRRGLVFRHPHVFSRKATRRIERDG